MKINEPIEHGRLREKAYPDIGEQLDAIHKGFLHLAQGGLDIGPDMRSMLARIQAVKQTYHKVTDE